MIELLAWEIRAKFANRPYSHRLVQKARTRSPEGFRLLLHYSYHFAGLIQYCSHDEKKGTASSAYGGLGMALGNNGFNIIGAMFLGQFRTGFIIFGVIAFIGVLISVFIVHEPSNLDEVTEEKVKTAEKKQGFSMETIKKVFPGWSVGRDYYLALIGKSFQGVGNFAVTDNLLNLRVIPDKNRVAFFLGV